MKNSKNILIALGIILVLGLIIIFYQVFKGKNVAAPADDPSEFSFDIGGDLEEKDLTYTNPGSDYTVVYPRSWTAQEAYSNITVLGKNNGSPTPPTIVLGVSNLTEVEATTPDEWFTANGLENNEVIEVLTKEEVEINGRKMTLVIQNDTANQTKVIHYVYFADDGKVIIMSHAPYIEDSLESVDFENIVKSLVTQS